MLGVSCVWPSLNVKPRKNGRENIEDIFPFWIRVSDTLHFHPESTRISRFFREIGCQLNPKIFSTWVRECRSSIGRVSASTTANQTKIATHFAVFTSLSPRASFAKRNEATDLSRPTRRFRSRCLLFTTTASVMCGGHTYRIMRDASHGRETISSSSGTYLNASCVRRRKSRATATMLRGGIEKRRKSVIY